MTPNQIKAVEVLASSSLESLKSAAERKTAFTVMPILLYSSGECTVGVYFCDQSSTIVNVDEWPVNGTVDFTAEDCLHVSEMLEMMSL